MSIPQSAAVRNHLLSSLPSESLQQLLPKLTPVTLALRQELYAPDGPIEAAYFLESGMVSLVAHLDDGMQAEVGVIGREGMLGVSLVAGVDTSFSESMVQMAGAGFRMAAGELRRELETNAPFLTMLLRYNEALQAQIMQTAACNGRHGWSSGWHAGC